MTDAAAERVPVSAGTSFPRRIAVMPVYNEESTVISVLERLEPLTDEIVVVDDGSTDRSRELILTWTESRPHVQPIFFKRNRGMSAAYYAAFANLARRRALGELRPDDVIISVDADGQHEPADVQALISNLDEGYDAVIARRDLSGYSPYKRLGNWLLSLWASLWAGQRLYDVESGFRVFRLGALADALRYYRGYRYSETVEVAVVLARLGYWVSNDVLAAVPIYRSRTRLRDGLIDLITMVAAWWRVAAGRNRPQSVPSWATYLLPSLGLLALAFMAVDLLVHRLFLGNDSIHSYAHVWYISEQLFDHAELPLRISLLDSGRAIAFPYAFAPYLISAVLFQLFGDWAVTLMMAVAVVGVVWAAGLARPIVRDPWLLLIFVINPFFIDAVFSFQFASLWSILFFFLFIWAFERRRHLLAASLLWLTVSSHPILGGAVAGVYGMCLLAFDRSKVRPLLVMSIPVGVALVPIYWMMMLTPSVRENSLLTVAVSVLDSLPRRASILLMPFALTLLAPHLRRYYVPSLASVSSLAAVWLLLAAGPVPSVHVVEGSYYGAVHRGGDTYAAFFGSPQFQPGATYRVLEPNEREDGMYRFMRHGAVLSNEFFSESVFRRSWTREQYGCYAAFKGIDYVVVENAYLKRYHVNEKDLIQSLVEAGRAEVHYTDARNRYTVYDLRPFVSQQRGPTSLKQCGLY